MNTEKMLEKEGWTIECESPFEIRHEDGSFATGQAARYVVLAMEQEARIEVMHRSLTVIEGAAALAKQIKDGHVSQFWASVQAEARKGLELDDEPAGKSDGPAMDAEEKVDAIWANLSDRRGIRQALDEIDDDIQDEIKEELAAIIRG